jgi:hypothetical protein
MLKRASLAALVILFLAAPAAAGDRPRLGTHIPCRVWLQPHEIFDRHSPFPKPSELELAVVGYVFRLADVRGGEAGEILGAHGARSAIRFIDTYCALLPGSDVETASQVLVDGLNSLAPK